MGSSKPYLTADRVSLTEEQFMKVEENVHSIQSEGPIYVSIMNKSNVGTDGLYIIVSLAFFWTHFQYYLVLPSFQNIRIFRSLSKNPPPSYIVLDRTHPGRLVL